MDVSDCRRAGSVCHFGGAVNKMFMAPGVSGVGGGVGGGGISK